MKHITRHVKTITVFYSILISILTTAGLIISIQSLFAWSDPTTDPPICDSGDPGCDPPLNAGPLLQSKSGGLWINTDGDLPYGLIVENGYIGIGDIAPDALLDISSSTALTMFRVDDNGDGDATPFLIDGSGNVGIGTGTPGSLLDVNGGIDISADSAQLRIGASNDYTIEYDGSANTLVFNNSGNDADIRIESVDDSNLFNIDASQNAVIIGKAAGDSLGYSLDVKGSNKRAARFAMTIDDSNTSSALEIIGGTLDDSTDSVNAAAKLYGAQTQIRFQNNGTAADLWWVTGNESMVVFQAPGAGTRISSFNQGMLKGFNFKMSTRTTNAMNFTFNEGVGINIDASSLNDGTGIITFPSFYGIKLSDPNGTQVSISDLYGIYSPKMTGGGNNYGIVLDGDGPGADLVLGSGRDVKLYANSSDLIVDLAGGGNVGIGAANPKTTLEVSSVIKSTPTDSPGTCDANSRGGMYFDDSEDAPCYCNNTGNWVRFDTGAVCG